MNKRFDKHQLCISWWIILCGLCFRNQTTTKLIIICFFLSERPRPVRSEKSHWCDFFFYCKSQSDTFFAVAWLLSPEPQPGWDTRYSGYWWENLDHCAELSCISLFHIRIQTDDGGCEPQRSWIPVISHIHRPNTHLMHTTRICSLQNWTFTK